MSDGLKEVKELFTFVTGAVRENDLIYLAVTDDSVTEPEDAHFFLASWDDGNWVHDDGRMWPAVAVDVSRKPLAQMATVGPLGEVAFNGSGDAHDEQIRSGGDSPENRGTLRALRAVHGQLFAAGMDRQVYRRDDPGNWTLLTSPDMWPGDEVVGFEAIHGFAADDLYAVGWEGEIWHYDGKRWLQIASPTNNILTDVCCAGDGKVYACGRKGLLLRGRGDEWRVLEQEEFADDLWSMRWFGDRLYLSGLHGVWELIDDDIVPVDFGDDWPESTYHLSACEDALISIGAKDILMFDGENWTRIA